MKPKKRASLIVLITLCLGFLGYNQAVKIPESLEPEVASQSAAIYVAAPGLSAQLVEREIIATLEDELRSLPEVKASYGAAQNGFAALSLELTRGAAQDAGWQEQCRERLQKWRVKNQDTHPYISEPMLSVEPLIGYDSILFVPYHAVEAIQKDLYGLQQVRDITTLAHSPDQIVVEFNNEDLDAAKLHPLVIKEAITTNNTRIPGGVTRRKGRVYSVQTNSSFESLDDLKALEVRDPKNNEPTALEDIVNIYTSNGSHYEPQAYSQSERQAVLAIRKTESTKSADFQQALEPVIEKHAATVFLENNSTIQQQKKAVFIGALCSMAIVFVIIALSIGVREGFVISLSIPIVIGIAALFISLTPVTLNIISLAAVILSLSLIIDGHIVVVDANNRRKRTVKELVTRFGNVLVVSVVTTVVSFSPIYFADHALADYLGSMFIVLLITLGVSLVYSCLVTPFLSKHRVTQSPSKLLDKLSGWHSAVLTVLMEKKAVAFTVCVLILGIGGFSVTQVPKAFFPEQKRDYKVLSMLCEKPRTNSELNKIAQDVASGLSLEKPAYFIGMEAPNLSAFQPAAKHDMRLINLIVPADFQIAQCEALESKFSDFQFELHQANVGPKIKYPVAFELAGDSQSIQSFLGELNEKVQGDEHIKHLVYSQHQDLNAYDITINPDNEGDFSRQDVALAVSLNTQGVPVTQLMENGKSTQVILKAEANHPNPQNSLENCYVFSTNKKVPAILLHEIASIKKEKFPQHALHKDGESIGRAFLYPSHGTDDDVALNAVMTHIDLLQEKYPDLSITENGQENATDEATQAIVDVLPWVLFLLLTLLLLKEWSIKRVFIILSVLPFAFAGAAIGLFICGQSQGFISLIGLVSLLGIVVNNAILWLDALNNQTASTNNYLLATQERFRAITVTSLSGIATLVPLYCFGGDIWKPLAATLIFGLIFAYVAIVLILPIVASSLSVHKHTHAS